MSTIDKETTSPKPEADTKTSETEMMISIDSMHKWFDDFHVLKNINLEVIRGE